MYEAIDASIANNIYFITHKTWRHRNRQTIPKAHGFTTVFETPM